MPNTLSPRAAAIAAADIINSATPLECALLGVHPRLLCVRHPLDGLRQRVGAEPWKTWFADLTRHGESLLGVALPDRLIGTPTSTFDIRQLGGHLIDLALLYRMTERAAYRERILLVMQRLAAEKDWGTSLIYGHWAQGFAIALDWLWHDLDEPTRQSHVETLYARTRHVFDHWATYIAGEPFGYTWNISAVVLGGVMAAAACIYGERPDVGPLANLAWEKMRMQSLALGPDGVSPEGIMYGGYYASYLTANFVLSQELLGDDLFAATPWFSRYAASLHAQSLPRSAWKADDAFFMQGDAHGPIFGLESVVRVIASATGDGVAQWFADELLRSGHIGISAFSFLLYDPDIKPTPPRDAQPFALMEDYGIAAMRSNWTGRESASVFKSGPNVGHHAARRFSHPLGGGHMYPNNGELQVFAHGGWILTYPGYVYKNTHFHNTLLVNGAGQYGEKSEWFEDLPYRQRRLYPSLERADHHGAWDHCTANLLHAYPVELGLRQLRRHVLYIRPDTWVILDALESDAPVTPTLLFHTGFPVHADGPGAFRGSGASAGGLIRVHTPAGIVATTEEQPRVHTGGETHGTMPLLRLSSGAPAAKHLIVTSVEAYPAKAPAAERVRIELAEGGSAVRVRAAGLDGAIVIRPFGGWPASHEAPARSAGR